MDLARALSIIWAISQCVEIDEWEKEDIASLLNVTTAHLEEIFEEAIEDFNTILDTNEELAELLNTEEI